MSVPGARGLDEWSDEELLSSARLAVDTGEIATRVLPQLAKKLTKEFRDAAGQGDREAVVMLAQLSAMAYIGASSLYVSRISKLYDEIKKRNIKSEDVDKLEDVLAAEYAAEQKFHQEVFEAEQEALKALPEGPERDAVVYSLEEMRRRREAV